MREILDGMGISGKPDFVVKGTDLLIFCDSSFWHGRRTRETSGKAFKINRTFWTRKLMMNRSRDLRNNRRLRAQGWSVARFWDTDILRKPEKVKLKLRRMI
jgi:DNA mismatch endonuclease (patch repair protein)